MSAPRRDRIDPALDDWMAAGAGGDTPCCERHETPIAKVYVFADRVLKLKKPVDFGFLDFSSLDKRAWASRRELEFNQKIAPDVYRTLHPVVREAGGFRLGGEGEVVEWALEMRRFDTDAILANHPERADGVLAERLGREVAAVQARAPATPQGPQGEGRGAAGLDYVIGSNAEQLRSLADGLGGEEVERLIADTRAAFERQAPLLDRRCGVGLVRRCHGDLHLGNIVVEAGRPVLFDCIEFSDVLSEIDVMYDAAFLLMDLSFRGRGAAANRVLNAWVDEAGRNFDGARLSGLAALPLFQAVRAAVRAHVNGHGGDLPLARRYLRAAQDHLQPTQPMLYAVGGLSGTGKSTLAKALARQLGPAPGAVVLRSDEVRKRLWGVAPDQRLPKAAYTPGQSQRVYTLTRDEARVGLQAGWPVVLDAAFLTPQARVDASALAAELRVPFHGLWLEAPSEVLRERLRNRRDDASDADEQVLEGQLTEDLGLVDWRRIDTMAGLDAQVAASLG